MKRNLFYLLMLVCSVSVFTACGDDDDVKYPIDEEIAGIYKGTLDVFVSGENIVPNTPKNISITNAGDNKINMGLKNLEILGMDLTIDIPNCEVKESADGYTFTGSQTLTLQAPIGNCPTTVNGTVSDGKTTINLDITVPAQNNLKVKVTYKGTKLKGGESSEAKILSFTFDSSNEANAIIVSQPVEKEGAFSFVVTSDATAEQIKALVPTIIVSEKATLISVAETIDFNEAVTYMVVAENGTVTNYSVRISGKALIFDFEEWENVPEVSPVFNGYDKPKPTDLLATSAEGATMLRMYGVTDMPVFKTEDKKSGKYAIKLVTMDTSEQANGLVPAITSGSVFTGKFDLEYLDMETFEKLECTRFGISYDKKPLRFKGSYKYKPGATFIDGSDYLNIVEVKDKIDECSIQAVLYKITSDSDVLTGKDINKSEKRVAIAVLADGSAKENYTDFDIPFEFLPGKTYETGAKYKLAIVCSSSKEGDFFKGAGGSTLILDNLEIIGE